MKSATTQSSTQVHLGLENLAVALAVQYDSTGHNGLTQPRRAEFAPRPESGSTGRNGLIAWGTHPLPPKKQPLLRFIEKTAKGHINLGINDLPLKMGQSSLARKAKTTAQKAVFLVAFALFSSILNAKCRDFVRRVCATWLTAGLQAVHAFAGGYSSSSSTGRLALARIFSATSCGTMS